jgi:hypothetical protein
VGAVAERLERRTFLHRNLNMQVDHEGKTLSLVPTDSTSVTHRAMNSGNWSVASNWASGTVPSDDQHLVWIPSNMSITYNLNEATPKRIGKIRVDGTLSMANTISTKLLVDTIVVTETGTFKVGKSGGPGSRDGGDR